MRRYAVLIGEILVFICIFGYRFNLKVNWKIGLFYLVFMPILLSLGFWQLERADSKQAMLATYDERIKGRPMTMEQLLKQSDLAYQRSLLTGFYDNDRSFLLDNRTNQGRVGYDVISPFILEAPGIEGKEDPAGVEVVLVNRGWLPMGPSRDQLPAIPGVAGLQKIVAVVNIPTKESFVLADETMPHGWPKVIQKIDLTGMTKALDQNIFPYMLQLENRSTGALQTVWKPIIMQPEKHMGYAVQWFALAITLTILFAVTSIKRAKEVGSE